jgi:signal transduction histidine kinase
LQEPAAEQARVELEALGSALSEVLRLPAELADEAARRESLRRLSWFMHQLAGPIMRLRNSIGDLQNFIAQQAQVGDALVPDADSARRAAAMTGGDLATYSVRGRLDKLAGAVDEINRLQYQIRAFRNAQRDLQPDLIDLDRFLNDIAQSARDQLPGLRIEVECDIGLRLVADRVNLRAAFEELVTNSCREFRVRQTVRPELVFSGKLNNGSIVLGLQDNALPRESNLPTAVFDEDVTTYAGQRLGTGLGLAIVHEIILRHRGRCSLLENVGPDRERIPGVMFIAELPVLSLDGNKENSDVN